MKHRSAFGFTTSLAMAFSCVFAAADVQAAATDVCQRFVTANVVAFDKPLMYNRMGAGNVNGMMYALERDVVNVNSLLPLTAGGTATSGQVDLRPDKRHRPLVLRIRVGDCLTVNLRNLMTANPNPFKFDTAADDVETIAGQVFPASVDEQVADRTVGFHVSGMQLVNGIGDDSSMVGRNHLGQPGSQGAIDAVNGSLVPIGGTGSYTLYAEKEGVFLAKSDGATFGSDANQGHSSLGLFGQVIVEPAGAAIYRGQVFEEEMRLAADADGNGVLDAGEKTAQSHPIINYEASYPSASPWTLEGKAGLPILNMMKCSDATHCEIVHSEINAVVAGPNADGTFPPSTYPLEAVGRRNPTIPNRLEPFRDFASVWHDEPATAQAFPGFFATSPVFKYVLAGVKDGFMINYGSGGIGSEIIANRLRVGPMHDCLTCAYEEFFLTSYTVGDPGMTVDIPANTGLETLLPGGTPAPGTQGPKATYAIGAEDPANIHHSYTGDFAKIRNTHIGKEQHVFHLHNHQWLYNPNDDNSNYMDAQGVGPGIGYSFEINFGGSGNRNKSAGDSIFHCHFYPHFAQGMWYHWRHHDAFEPGTVLASSNVTFVGGDVSAPQGYHTTPWALKVTTPAAHPQVGLPAGARVRAYPDGEIVAGTPIPAVVPLPGKPMAPMPGDVAVVPNVNTTTASAFHGDPSLAGTTVPVGSNALVVERTKNPGFPFWVAGIEHIVGQRPPTPPLDMLTAAQATALHNAGGLWSQINPSQADGWDGGLPRNALEGYAAGGESTSVESPTDFSKVVHKAKPVYFPEEGTDVEKVAMAFHAQKYHDTYLPDGTPVLAVDNTGFRTNGGGGPVVGAPFHNPCIDDKGNVLHAGVLGEFFSGESLSNPMSVRGRSVFNSDTPRIYKGTFLQFDAVLNKVGYHYPQQRIVALWQDVGPVINKAKAPEPLVMRFDTFDCAVYHNSNLVPETYEMDDYQVRTPTDIIAQHIHLPKWDLTTTDGAANGWNYEDGTLSPGAVQERIHAINAYNNAAVAKVSTNVEGNQIVTSAGATVGPDGVLHEELHPYFKSVAAALDGAPVGKLAARKTFSQAWLGARTTTQRWFFDPVVNVAGVDRGLGIIFTHDHYGPSTHQQIGLYATALTEPAGSTWKHNETGLALGCATAVNPAMPGASLSENTTPCRWDGGPTSWQAQIHPKRTGQLANVGAETLEQYREFYFEYSDFQHAYEAGVYVGTNQRGLPLAGTGPGFAMAVGNEGNALFDGQAANAFRFAINPPARFQIEPVFPDLVVEADVCVKDAAGAPLLTRPCPQAIDVQDPGVLVVNYRHDPVGLRIYDPNKPGPDGKPGMQADGPRGDLAFALASNQVRAIPEMNAQPTAATVIKGTRFPPPINRGGVNGGDPFTPMLRVFTGDVVRVKMQAGGHEEEHNASIIGMKWLQAGSGHGRAPNSGWRNAQAGGISEQFTLTVPVVPSAATTINFTDYGYTMDASNDGWWSGTWGILRSYNRQQGNLSALPDNPPANNRITIANANIFGNRGACPTAAPVRAYNVTAVLANDVLANAFGVDIPAKGFGDPIADNSVGGSLRSDEQGGGTLVYNHRRDQVTGTILPEGGTVPVTIINQGPIHDPTAILYVRTEDLVNPNDVRLGLKPGVPVEPLVLRAGAGDCIQVNLRNRLPALQQVNIGTPTVPVLVNNSTAPDLATYSMIQGVVKRDRFGLEGATTFNSNLFRPSSWVSLTPQLVAADQAVHGGRIVGTNPANNAVAPGGTRTYFWYAGDLSAKRTAVATYRLYPVPVELGGANLFPADTVKQGAKSLVGALVVEPAGATWVENTQVFDHQDGIGTRLTRAQATVTATPGTDGSGGTFRDFSLVLTKGLTQYYSDNATGLLLPVEHMNGEGVGIPEDSQEASGMALNYGVEPMWFRFGILPEAPFGNADTLGSYGAIPNAHQAFSNVLTGGDDPATPVFQANAGQQARIRITNPYGTSRGSTFALHGHVWQRDPYVCSDDQYGLNGKCDAPATGSIYDPITGNPLVGSRAIGRNPQGFAEGGRESWNAPSHFDIVLPEAGGANAVPGDYLFRDQGSFGSSSGVWGILRVP